MSVWKAPMVLIGHLECLLTIQCARWLQMVLGNTHCDYWLM